jgi:hypothetical protein
MRFAKAVAVLILLSLGIAAIAPSEAKKKNRWSKPFSGGGALSIGKPFNSGGGLSIDKPFDSGGGLSIGKPLNQGGDLSINRVYVPKKFRIGRVQSLAEVVIPVCWGSPQDCRGVTDDANASNKTAKEQTNYPYYVIARFICKDRRTGLQSGKVCDVVKSSSRSCRHALEALNDHPSTFGDPCTVCADIRDELEYWDGTPAQHIQGGPCAGY